MRLPVSFLSGLWREQCLSPVRFGRTRRRARASITLFAHVGQQVVVVVTRSGVIAYTFSRWRVVLFYSLLATSGKEGVDGAIALRRNGGMTHGEP
eukprot:scaffold268324_cov31-Tisochrysis_lutea.AAC.1